MARFNYSGVAITAGTGRLNSPLGGTVLMRNGVVRNYTTPTNPQTQQQSEMRARFTFFSSTWATLTTAEKEQWNDAAKSGEWQIPDSFTGSARNPRSGFELYVRLNLDIAIPANGTGSAVTVPPTKQTPGDTILTGGAAAAAAGTMTLTYSGTLGGDENHVVFATPPLSAGKTKLPSSFLRLIEWNDVGASPIDIAAEYVAVFGAITGAAGKVIFFKVFSIDGVTGQRRLVGTVRVVIAV